MINQTLFKAALQESAKLKEEYLGHFIKVCEIESPTSHKAGVDAVGDYFIQMAKARGWKVEKVKEDVSGDLVFITFNPDSKAEPISLSAHMDTVHPIGSFGYPAVKVEGNKLYGPGTVDCKGGAVAAFFAMDVLDRIGFTDRPVQLLLQSDEEVGSRCSNRHTIETICKKAQGSLAFLNFEGHKEGSVCVQRKGIVRYLISVSGKAAHASACAKSGANAIVEAANKIIEIDKFKDPEGITCNCGTIRGGSTGNTVPENCEFEVDVRFLVPEQREYIDKIIRDIVSKNAVNGCTSSVRVLSARTCMKREEKNLKLLEKINAILREVGFTKLVPKTRGGGSDAAEITECGIPCLDSLGVEGGESHQRSEFAYISSLEECVNRTVAIILGL